MKLPFIGIIGSNAFFVSDFLKSKGFWRWRVIICKSCFLDFVHRLYFNKIYYLQRFGSWIFFRLQVKRKERNLAVGPPGWASLSPRLRIIGFLITCFAQWSNKPETSYVISAPKHMSFHKALPTSYHPPTTSMVCILEAPDSNLGPDLPSANHSAVTFEILT
jgi:hypothetical protein